MTNYSALSPEYSHKEAHWLVTGGCGVIGTSLISHILKVNPNTKIKVLDNLAVGAKEDLAKVCEYIEGDINQPLSMDPQSGKAVLMVGDIRDYQTCRKACKGVDVVVHLAANTGVGPSVENPRQDMETNVLGTFNMLEASRKNHVKRFILASSGAPIGEVDPPIHEEKAPKPVSPYGASKLAGEGYCSTYYRTFGLPTVSLRFGNVYGPRSKNKSSVVAKFFRQALAGETLEIYGDGSQTRDFIYIADLVKAICLAVDPAPLSTQSPSPGNCPWGEVFQIATHKESTVNEITEIIKALVEKETEKKVSVVHSEPRLGDVKRNYSDISKAKKILGYEPQFDLEAGIKRTFEYFKARAAC